MMQRVIRIVLFSVLLGLVLGLTVAANADEVTQKKVAVIDSGFTFIPFDTSYFKLCKEGHFDFNRRKPNLGHDDIGHGSFVTSTINTHAGNADFCFLQYKIIGKGVKRGDLARAILMAHRNGAVAINMSVSINMYDRYLHRVVKYVTDKGTKIFASAGNEDYNLNKYCRVYPSCFKGINKNLVIVGALNGYNNKATYSNHGARIDVWHMGDLVTLFGRARGTSFAAPRALGDYLRTLK